LRRWQELYAKIQAIGAIAKNVAFIVLISAINSRKQNDFITQATESRARGDGSKRTTIILVMFARIAIIFSTTRTSNIAPTAVRK
jgi:hypothetical protein